MESQGQPPVLSGRTVGKTRIIPVIPLNWKRLSQQDIPARQHRSKPSITGDPSKVLRGANEAVKGIPSIANVSNVEELNDGGRFAHPLEGENLGFETSESKVAISGSAKTDTVQEADVTRSSEDQIREPISSGTRGGADYAASSHSAKQQAASGVKESSFEQLDHALHGHKLETTGDIILDHVRVQSQGGNRSTPVLPAIAEPPSHLFGPPVQTPPHSVSNGAVYPFPPNGHAHHTSEPHRSPPFPPPCEPIPAHYPPGMEAISAHPHIPRQPLLPTDEAHQSFSTASGFLNTTYTGQFPSEPHDNGSRPSSRASSKTKVSNKGNGHRLHQIVSSSEDPANGFDAMRRIFSPPPRDLPVQRAPQLHFLSSDASFMLRDFIMSKFGDPQHSDFMLELSNKRRPFEPLSLPAHGLVLSRSPTLAALMAASSKKRPQVSGPPSTLPVLLSDKFITRMGMVEALKTMYGFPLLDPLAALQQLPPLPERSSRGVDPPGMSTLEPMEFNLAYWAAGHFLQLRYIVENALDVVVRLLRWDTLAQALSFALDGGLSPSWIVDFGAEASNSLPTSSDSHKSETTSIPTYGIYSSQLLLAAVDFIVFNLPHDFALVHNAPQLPQMPRLPYVPDVRSSITNPRLSKIQFGQVPAHDDMQASFVSTMASSVLLSLPYPLLQAVLQHPGFLGHLGQTKAISVARAIVEQREEQRTNVIRSRYQARRNPSQHEGIWQNLQWEETLFDEPQSPLGLVLRRRWRNTDTPRSTRSRNH